METELLKHINGIVIKLSGFEGICLMSTGID